MTILYKKIILYSLQSYNVSNCIILRSKECQKTIFVLEKNIMGKVGLVLFVKNEFRDIYFWVSWHLAQGFDEIIIFDDHSKDGTFELLSMISDILPVRILRAEHGHAFNVRQRNTYIKAIQIVKENFEWVLVLDADEYLNLKNHKTVQEFLSSYDDCDGIAINWCCYGSSNNLVYPPTPNVFINYNGHCDIDYEYSYIPKSFFRPNKTKDIYINPHRFEIEGRYVNIKKQNVEWEERKDACLTLDPVWEIATINHYITRSCEHFIDKYRRRYDIRNSNMGINLFNYLNRNDVREEKELNDYYDVYEKIYFIQNSISQKIRNTFSENYIVSNIIQKQYGKQTIEDKFYELQSHHDGYICIDKKTRHLTHIKEITSDYEKAVFFESGYLPGVMFIFSAETSDYIVSKHDERVSCVQSYNISHIIGNELSLQNNLSQRYCGCDMHFYTGNIEVNRTSIEAWERVKFKEIDRPNSEYINYITETVSNILNKKVFLNDKNLRIDNDIFLSVLSSMPYETLILLFCLSGFPHVSWLKPEHHFSV